jgi:predicted kinase
MNYHSSKPVVIIISGLPATGKSRIGRNISSRFRLPLISKDPFKEAGFDHLGIGDRQWSKKLSAMAKEDIFYVMTQLLAVGNSIIIDCNFKNEDIPRLHVLLEEKNAMVVQIHCRTEKKALRERYVRRMNTPGKRHPGHVDDQYLPELDELLASGEDDILPLTNDPLIHHATDESTKIILKKLDALIS